MNEQVTLTELRNQFCNRKMLSMPIAGAICWAAAGVLGAYLNNEESAAIALFVCMPLVFPIAFVIGEFLHEHPFSGSDKNELDSLFLFGVLMANLVWGIAIPFWLVMPSSLPLSAGILAGLMWVPFSWIMNHWVGLFHAIARTIFVTLAWLFFPNHRFTLIPAIIVLIYLISIHVLAKRIPISK